MLKRFVNVKDEEVGAVLLSFVYFFTLMCGYAILKPLRDEMATAGGVKNVSWLFTATFVVMLVAVPAFSALVARWPRQKVLPFVYRFFLLNYVIREGRHFFRNDFWQHLLHDAVDVQLPALDDVDLTPLLSIVE